MAKFNDLPGELIEKIILELEAQDIVKIPKTIRQQFYYHISLKIVLKLLDSIEKIDIIKRNYRIFINFGQGNVILSDNYFVIDHNQLLQLKYTPPEFKSLFQYFQIWPGKTSTRKDWQIYLYSYPFCIKFLYMHSRKGVHLFCLKSLTIAKKWNFYNKLNHSFITDFLSKIPYSSFKRHNMICRFTEKLHLAELLMIPSTLQMFTSITEGKFNPAILKITVVNDKTIDILPVDIICIKEFPSLVVFELYFLGEETSVNSAQRLIKKLGPDIRRVTIEISILDIAELTKAINRLNFLKVRTTVKVQGKDRIGAIRETESMTKFSDLPLELLEKILNELDEWDLYYTPANIRHQLFLHHEYRDNYALFASIRVT
ncbi:hypothetical protein KGF54_000384 [Candida jiufengensis]|uniref:uncharacterized protein n=1 Tax=Candida jiufengensis TaxID=497108 RepID=UPI002224CE39|nr:uncharacterized protein KGF54_000384 [Candida jiufengensis]KAI5956767.1 hypothetical protein KGF54_000384 [Candida jiufengensis]